MPPGTRSSLPCKYLHWTLGCSISDQTETHLYWDPVHPSQHYTFVSASFTRSCCKNVEAAFCFQPLQTSVPRFLPRTDEADSSFTEVSDPVHLCFPCSGPWWQTSQPPSRDVVRIQWDSKHVSPLQSGDLHQIRAPVQYGIDQLMQREVSEVNNRVIDPTRVGWRHLDPKPWRDYAPPICNIK